MEDFDEIKILKNLKIENLQKAFITIYKQIENFFENLRNQNTGEAKNCFNNIRFIC